VPQRRHDQTPELAAVRGGYMTMCPSVHNESDLVMTLLVD